MKIFRIHVIKLALLQTELFQSKVSHFIVAPNATARPASPRRAHRKYIFHSQSFSLSVRLPLKIPNMCRWLSVGCRRVNEWLVARNCVKTPNTHVECLVNDYTTIRATPHWLESGSPPYDTCARHDDVCFDWYYNDARKTPDYLKGDPSAQPPPKITSH